MTRATARMLILLAGTMSALPLAGQEKFSARIRVDVGGDKDLNPLVTSYIGRELRSLPGVTVAEDEYQYEIKVIVQQDVTGSGVVLGYSMAYVVMQVVTERWAGSAVEAAGVKDPKSKLRQSLARSLSGAVFLDTFKLVGGPADSLQQICKELVAELDGNQLERDRREFQRRLDAKKPR